MDALLFARLDLDDETHVVTQRHQVGPQRAGGAHDQERRAKGALVGPVVVGREGLGHRRDDLGVPSDDPLELPLVDGRHPGPKPPRRTGGYHACGEWAESGKTATKPGHCSALCPIRDRDLISRPFSLAASRRCASPWPPSKATSRSTLTSPSARSRNWASRARWCPCARARTRNRPTR